MLRTVIALASILISLPLLAREHSHVAHLDGGEEVPPNASLATGFAVLTLEQGATNIRISYRYEGIASGVTGGHIHGPAAAGANAGILFNLAPPADTAAQVLDLSFPIDAAQLQDLRDGLWYVNLHSTSFPGGEIRGQLDIIFEDGLDIEPTPGL
ncbi:MAG TPA: CHRD domain-containing protein [Xanthomonadaceae bacterium]|nr:CHRD domain-containing protein [Xanthomonadaceae bacterium]